MSEYIYDLSADPRFKLSEFFRPLNGIPVTRRQATISHADLSMSGLVVMELPNALANKLRANFARIDPYSQTVKAHYSGDEKRTKQIYVFDIVDVD